MGFNLAIKGVDIAQLWPLGLNIFLQCSPDVV